jgi:uncharacterized protein (DUF849 family)
VQSKADKFAAMPLLQAALNGPYSKADHPAMPLTIDELARDAAACARAGAGAVHMHPRDADGRETLEPELIDAAVLAAREAAGIPIGVSTAAWIEPDFDRRLRLLAEWRAPDYASVNVSEPGFRDVMKTLLRNGIGIEAGVWSVQDAQRLADSGLADRLLRILVEPVDPPVDDALETIDEIHAALDAHGITDVRRLEHTDSDSTWVVISDAVRRGVDTRVGLEDCHQLPDETRASDNAALIRAARALGAGG